MRRGRRDNGARGRRREEDPTWEGRRVVCASGRGGAEGGRRVRAGGRGGEAPRVFVAGACVRVCTARRLLGRRSVGGEAVARPGEALDPPASRWTARWCPSRHAPTPCFHPEAKAGACRGAAEEDRLVAGVLLAVRGAAVSSARGVPCHGTEVWAGAKESCSAAGTRAWLTGGPAPLEQGRELTLRFWTGSDFAGRERGSVNV